MASATQVDLIGDERTVTLRCGKAAASVGLEYWRLNGATEVPEGPRVSSRD